MTFATQVSKYPFCEETRRRTQGWTRKWRWMVVVPKKALLTIGCLVLTFLSNKQRSHAHWQFTLKNLDHNASSNDRKVFKSTSASSKEKWVRINDKSHFQHPKIRPAHPQKSCNSSKVGPIFTSNTLPLKLRGRIVDAVRTEIVFSMFLVIE